MPKSIIAIYHILSGPFVQSPLPRRSGTFTDEFPAHSCAQAPIQEQEPQAQVQVQVQVAVATGGRFFVDGLHLCSIYIY